jgi:hypothetical protein
VGIWETERVGVSERVWELAGRNLGDRESVGVSERECVS